ncbi:hypothetical protein LJC55_02950 [Eubacteriales bacterium OttesenSCG-928-N14]|nr:hypothetical protein [Eubacteriales bacterium OttesenSCG-928-N14]
MRNYWKEETPQVIDTGRNVLRYYKQAKRLQVAYPNWIDNDGNSKPGKTVTIDLEAVYETKEAIAVFEEIGGYEYE